MPLISIRLAAGRDRETLSTLVGKVSEATADALNVPIERVGVHIFELDGDHVGRGGRLASDTADPPRARPVDRAAERPYEATKEIQPSVIPAYIARRKITG